MNVEKELAALQKLTVDGLRAKFAEVFSEPTRSRHKEYLVKRIIWRMQANAEGGLSERALARARELANDADLRITAPRKQNEVLRDSDRTKALPCRFATDNRLPLPGSIIRRDYKGRQILVHVLQDGFEYEGEVHKSLSAIAKVVSGAHWNGYRFFGLSKKEARA